MNETQITPTIDQAINYAEQFALRYPECQPTSPVILDTIRRLYDRWNAIPGQDDVALTGSPQHDRNIVFDIQEIAEGGDPRPGLEASAARIAKAQAELEDARESQRYRIRRAWIAGISESEIARLASVNRMTVRAALGK